MAKIIQLRVKADGIDIAARVRLLRAELYATRGGIDEREEVLCRQLESLDEVTRCAYVSSIARDALKQADTLCFVLSHLNVAMDGTEFIAPLNASATELFRTLEHLSRTGGARAQNVDPVEAERLTVPETEE